MLFAHSPHAFPSLLTKALQFLLHVITRHLPSGRYVWAAGVIASLIDGTFEALDNNPAAAGGKALAVNLPEISARRDCHQNGHFARTGRRVSADGTLGTSRVDGAGRACESAAW